MRNHVYVLLLLVISASGVRFGQKNSVLQTSLGHQAQQQQQHQHQQQQLLQRPHREHVVRSGTTQSEGEGTRLFGTSMTSATRAGVAPGSKATAPSERVCLECLPSCHVVCSNLVLKITRFYACCEPAACCERIWNLDTSSSCSTAVAIALVHIVEGFQAEYDRIAMIETITELKRCRRLADYSSQDYGLQPATCVHQLLYIRRVIISLWCVVCVGVRFLPARLSACRHRCID